MTRAGAAGTIVPRAAAPALTAMIQIAQTRSTRMTAVDWPYGTPWRRLRITARSASPELAGVRLLIVLANDTIGTRASSEIGWPTAAIKRSERIAHAAITDRFSATTARSGRQSAPVPIASQGLVRQTSSPNRTTETEPQTYQR